MFKKILSLIVSLMLIISVIPVGITNASGFSDNTAFTVSSVTANPGETVGVTVSVNNNPGILGAILDCTYSDELTLVKADSGEAFSAHTMTTSANLSSPCRFTWDAIELGASDIKDGTVLTLTFKVSDNAVPGTQYMVKISSAEGDIVDTNLNTVVPKFTSGIITVGSAGQTSNVNFAVSSVTANPGETVDVTVSVNNNPGILGAILDCTYSDELTLVKADSGEAFSAHTMTTSANLSSPCRFTWDAIELGASDIKDGTVLTLTFKVSDSAVPGTQYMVEISSAEGDIVDSNLNTVVPKFTAGNITVSSTAPHVHSYSSSVTPPTCTQRGYTTYTCKCGDVKVGSYVPALGHKYNAGIVTKNPTCTEAGVKTYTCTVCGDTYIENIPANGHNYSAVVTAPTCTEQGYTTYTCSVCGDTYVSDYTDVTAHKYNGVVTREPTSTQPGVITYTCTVCGDTYTEDIPATGVRYNYRVSNGKATITGCDKSISGDITIPSKLDGYPVNSIGDEAFWGCSKLTSVTIPNSVTSIGYRAFYCCSGLTNIIISNSVTSIGDEAFGGCSRLTSIIVDKNNTTYDSRNGCNAIIETKINKLIAGCNNTVIPNSVTSIGDYAFNECSELTSVTIPESVTSIGDSAFYDCKSLASIFVDENNTTYDSRNGCNAIIETKTNKLIVGCKNTVIPNSVAIIGDDAFANCESLTNITIPDSVTSIGDSAFEDCSRLTSITIPNSVTSIGDSAFSWCKSLTSVTIPNSVTSIGVWAFYECISLTDVYYGGYIVNWKKIRIGGGNDELLNSKIHYKSHSNHTYKTTVTKATTTKSGSIVKTCTVCGAKTTTPIYYPKTFKLSTTSYIYDGKVKKPAVTVKNSAGKTISSANYTVTYASGRKYVGKYAVKVTFKGSYYSGSKMLYFNINPRNTSISKLTSGRKSFKVYLKKYTTQTTGYQIQYSTSSKFTGANTVTVSNRTTAKTISKLYGGKRYYVRCRTYKKVGNTNFFSSWSGAKAVTTKR